MSDDPDILNVRFQSLPYGELVNAAYRMQLEIDELKRQWIKLADCLVDAGFKRSESPADVADQAMYIIQFSDSDRHASRLLALLNSGEGL